MEDYRLLGLTRCRTMRSRRRAMRRWVVWGVAMAMIPASVFAAYQPAVLLVANNLSDLASATTARTNLGLGTASVKAASDGSKATVASINGSITSGHIATFADTSGTIGDGGVAPTGTVSSVTCGTGLTGGTFTTSGTCAEIGWTVTRYTSNTASVTLANTNNLLQAIAQAAPAALTVNLNATSPSAGMIQCVKDQTNSFATNNATVKTTDSSTIDGVTGSTGFTMNQNKQQTCFMFDGNANWMVM